MLFLSCFFDLHASNGVSRQYIYCKGPPKFQTFLGFILYLALTASVAFFVILISLKSITRNYSRKYLKVQKQLS